jgi:hypothetical protein
MNIWTRGGAELDQTNLALASAGCPLAFNNW